MNFMYRISCNWYSVIGIDYGLAELVVLSGEFSWISCISTCLVFLLMSLILWLRSWDCNCYPWKIDWYVRDAHNKPTKGHISCVGWGWPDARYGVWASDTEDCFSGLIFTLIQMVTTMFRFYVTRILSLSLPPFDVFGFTFLLVVIILTFHLNFGMFKSWTF